MITITRYNYLLYILSIVSYDITNNLVSFLMISISNINNITIPHNVSANIKIVPNNFIGPRWSFILIVYSNINTDSVIVTTSIILGRLFVMSQFTILRI